ncbi:MAG: hypothetical protein ABI543_12075 [Ignavibacteria bacterium]
MHRKVDTIDDEATLLQLEEIIHIIINNSKVKYDSLSEELKFSLSKRTKELDEDRYISYEEIKKNILNVLKND